MKMPDKNSQALVIMLLIPLLSIALHWRVFPLELQGIHLWRQAQTQTVVENFAEEGRHILSPRVNNMHFPDRILRLEFPLMQWVYSWLYDDSGGDVSASRWATFILGYLSVIGMFYFLSGLGFSKFYSALGAWCFNWSPLFYFYTLNPLPDNLALTFSILGLAVLAYAYRKNQYSFFILFQFLIGIAALIKLPYILFSVGSIPFLYQQLKAKNHVALLGLIGAFIVLLLPCFAWYAWVIPTWEQPRVLHGITAGDGFTILNSLQVLWATLISLLPELMLNYGAILFLFVGISRFWIKRKSLSKMHWSIIITLIAFFAYYLFELNIITTTHDYYLFPFLPFLFTIVGYGLRKMLSGPKPIRILTTLLLLLLPITAYLRSDSRWRHMGVGKTLNNNLADLKAITPTNALCVVGNDVSTQIFLYTINRKGWTFSNDELSAERLQQLISEGAEYFYSTSTLLESDPEIKLLLKQLILEKEGIRVYQLEQ